LCRFRGDKFLYLVDELESANAARPIADRLLAIFEESFYADGKEFKLSASIGFVVWGRTEAPLSEFIDILHLALGAAKGSGKGRYSAFTRVMHDPA
jgi:GGDEF domain-containing protein